MIDRKKASSRFRSSTKMNSSASIERLRAQLVALEAESAASDFPVYEGVVFKKLVVDSGQAKVYRAEFDGQDVAVKVFHVVGAALKAFRSEIKSLLYGTRVLFFCLLFCIISLISAVERRITRTCCAW
jgi:hypothetical protein